MRAGIFLVLIAVAACGRVVVEQAPYVPVPWQGTVDADDPDGSDGVAPDPAQPEPPEPEPDPAEPDPSAPEPREPEPAVPPADGWSQGWADREDEMLVLVNEMRQNGGDCPSRYFGPRATLVMNAQLQTAARLHSKDMADNDYFSHDSRNGDSPWDRIDAAGYTAQGVGENIAAGNASAEETFSQWVNSNGHCVNMMSSNATEIGIGYANGSAAFGHYWTQTFGQR